MMLSILVGLIAVLHLYFLYFEMFAWETIGAKTFRFDAHFMKKSKAMAANQGLYNGFLAAGLIWTFFIQNEVWKEYILMFFLTCILVAGVFGALTVSKRILYVQALPALIALGLLIMV